MASLSSSVVAEPQFVDSTVEEGGWRFIAKVDDTDATRRVDTLLAVPATGSTIEPGNLGGVLYRRDATGFWSAWAYNYGAADVIVRSFAVQEGIGTIPFGLVDSSGADGGVDLFEEPTAFEKGLLTTDPLFEYLSANPDNAEASDALIAFLQQVGYAAANLPFEKFQTAQQPARAYVLDGLAVELSELAKGASVTTAATAKANTRAAVASNAPPGLESNFLYDWLCWSATRAAPVATTIYRCGDWIREVTLRSQAGTEVDTGDVTWNLAVFFYETCFKRVCVQDFTQTTTYTGHCTPFFTTIVQTRAFRASTTEECCVPGSVPFDIYGNPPCNATGTPTETPILPSANP